MIRQLFPGDIQEHFGIAAEVHYLERIYNATGNQNLRRLAFFAAAALLRDPGFDPRFHLLRVAVGQSPPQIVSLWRIETICAASIFIDVKIELLFLGLAARLSSFQNLLRFLCEYFNSFTLFKNHLKCLT